MQRWIDRVVFLVAVVVGTLGAAGGPGWDSGHAIFATELDRTAREPLYGLVASVAAYLPAGEPGFRLAFANALLGAILLVGVVRATRALLPKDPVAGPVAAAALLLAPPFRDASGFAGPAMLASVGAVWAVAFALEHARTPARSTALAALACAAVTLGSAPWLGLLVGALVATWLWRTGARDVLALAAFAIGVGLVVLWIGAEGTLPGAQLDLGAAIAQTGRGSATIVVGAGLVGALFAAVTNLPHARWIAGAIGLAALHAVAFGGPVPLLALLAIGIAVIPSGVVRAIATANRHVVAAAAGAPIVVVAVLAGPALAVDDPGATPARLAGDLLNAQPAGPGVMFARRSSAWLAIDYAQRIAGTRPDYELAPVMPPTMADAAVKTSILTGMIAASDMPAFGRLDTRLALPRGRGFQLVFALPDRVPPVLPPARYTSQRGEEQAVLLAIDRARTEAVHGRLGAAARAAGLSERFGAGDLAILSTTAPSRPAMFGFVPNLDGAPPGPWLLELLGDDLAWSAGLDTPLVEAPRARKLHGLWCAIWRGQLAADDPAIAELGPEAVRATAEMLDALAPKAPTPTPPPAPAPGP